MFGYNPEISNRESKLGAMEIMANRFAELQASVAWIEQVVQDPVDIRRPHDTADSIAEPKLTSLDDYRRAKADVEAAAGPDQGRAA